MKKINVFLLSAFLLIAPFIVGARDLSAIDDCYVKDFYSLITVNADSSLTIKERIIADCAGLADKHGIFRILPTITKTDKSTIKNPVELKSITDFNGNPLKYTESNDQFNNTISWKIGDPDKTISGVNNYEITYDVKNAVRSLDTASDELYWNLTGNFWNLEIDKFSGNIVFPSGVSRTNSEIDYYIGDLGAKNKESASFSWIDENTLNFTTNRTLLPRQGITASIVFPKGFITPHTPSFLELYGDYVWFLIPLIFFIICYYAWFKFGKDPQVNKTVVPEFEIPENITPMEMGLVDKNGELGDPLISATIVDLAVKKFLRIEEIEKIGIFGKKDFKLELLKTDDTLLALDATQKIVIEKIFDGKSFVLLSELKKTFYKEIPKIKKTAIDDLEQKELIFKSGLTLKAVFIIIGFALMFGAFFVGPAGGLAAIGALLLSAIIFIFFGVLMPKRTQKGAELNWRIKGFKLYMKTAELYRARFNEKENIFEKFLPYAMVFGMTKLWIKKMEEIYGKEYFSNYHPAWYGGAFAGNFNADSFNDQISSLSSGIASNIGTSSGANGAGGAGGGGGGGGGGSW